MTHKAFTVVWDVELFGDLAAFWQGAAPDIRRELARACNEIDRTLATVPQSVGRLGEYEPYQDLWCLPGYQHSIAVVSAGHDLDRIIKVVRLYLAER
ncbi:MAG: hypothetical protein AB7U20_15225 [Planctomycetaceae bacterium]